MMTQTRNTRAARAAKARVALLPLVLASVFLLGGCLFGTALRIVPADLVMNSAYSGKFINERNNEPVTITPRPDGQYAVALEKETDTALVVDTPQRKLVVFKGEKSDQVTFMSLKVTVTGLRATALDLDLAAPGVKAALAAHGATATVSRGNITLHGLATTTQVKVLFSDPRFNHGLRPLHLKQGGELIYTFRRVR